VRIVVARRAPDVLPEAGALTLTLALALLKAGAAQTCGAARGCGERGGGALYTVRTVHNVRTGDAYVAAKRGMESKRSELRNS
jgi:hypothetical protein